MSEELIVRARKLAVAFNEGGNAHRTILALCSALEAAEQELADLKRELGRE